MRCSKWPLLGCAVVTGAVVDLYRPNHDDLAFSNGAPMAELESLTFNSISAEAERAIAARMDLSESTHQQLRMMATCPNYIPSDFQYFPKGDKLPLTEELNSIQAANAEKAANLAR